MKIDLHKFSQDEFTFNISHLKHEEKSSKGFVLVLPGAGYSHMGPCIYYPSTMLFEAGYEIVNIEYDLRWGQLLESSQTYYGKLMRFIEESVNSLDLPEDRLVLAKSIGTRLLASLDVHATKYIWLTPALKDDFVVEAILSQNEKSLVVIGDKDPFYLPDQITLFSESLVIKDADHGLDIDNCIDSSLKVLKELVQTIEKFFIKTN